MAGLFELLLYKLLDGAVSEAFGEDRGRTIKFCDEAEYPACLLSLLPF